MSTYMKLKQTPGARWAIARTAITGEFVALIESTPVAGDEEMFLALLTLDLPVTPPVVEHFFPKNWEGKRCPTFELMSLWYDLAPATVADGKDKV